MQIPQQSQKVRKVYKRVIKLGCKSLSDQDLLSTMLKCYCTEAEVKDLSQKLLKVIDLKSECLELQDLISIEGIDSLKALSICAALEFARRRIRPEGTKIDNAEDIYPLLKHLADRKQEHFIAISLNGAHEVIAIRVITIGLLNSCQIHPREVFADAICDRAAALIVAHNHPSGKLEPSKEDLEITSRLKTAAEILGIRLLDHLIFSRTAFLSFKDKGIF